MTGLFCAIHTALSEPDPGRKCQAVIGLAQNTAHDFSDLASGVREVLEPGRPWRPELVDPVRVPRRRLGSNEGRAALIHAIAHIEFNAINLALDAAYRFRDMPRQFTLDWLSVAHDEARHFEMLRLRLMSLGYAYGDFPAHDGLWTMARKTSARCLERMALVPRVLEARGLDVTPGMIERLESLGDHETVDILRVILEEEVRHVAIGTHWYRYCCEREGVEPVPVFFDLLRKYFGKPRGPFNIDARLLAGFTDEELRALEREAV